MPKVMLDKDYISNLNISEQIEGPFLLSEPGSIRAKAIGRLTGMHIIDKAIRDCIADIKRESQRRERLINEMETINKALETYNDLDIIKNKIDSVDDLLIIIDGLLNKMHRLDALEKKLNALEQQYSYAERVMGITDRLDECARLLAEASECAVKLKKLEKIYRRYEENTNNVRKITNNIKQYKQETEKRINSYASLLKDFAVCPLCGSEISGSTVDNIISHYKGIH